MFIKSLVSASVIVALSLSQGALAQSSSGSDGVMAYILSIQEDLEGAGEEAIAEQAENAKVFIEKYNDYTATLTELTSESVSLSGDNDCLANLRSIDLDIIPIDPMDILKPIKDQINDYIESSPCDMVTDEVNNRMEGFDFAADSPFGSVGVDSEESQAEAEKEIEEALARKEAVKDLVSGMGSDFSEKIEEIRSIEFTEDGSVDKSEEGEVIEGGTIKTVEDMVNSEDLLNISEVFGEYNTSDDD